MKYLKLLLFFVGLILIGTTVLANKPVREKQNINREWKFILSDIPGAEAPGFDDSGWTDMHLPHSFSIPYFMWYQVYTGYGWYRKEIHVPAEWADKHVTLEFEGAFLETEVYLNGSYIGKHVGGYTGFFFDITPYLHAGKNLLAVRVNNLWKPDVAPRAGDHQFSGGIYRDVYLNVTDPLHVDVHGTFVYNTPQVSKEMAVCEAQTEIRNGYMDYRWFTIETEILSPGGKVVAAKCRTTQMVEPGQVATVKQIFPAIKKPELWSPESPKLYKAVTTVTLDGVVADRYETTFGIRWFEWTADKGFFLNGEHYYLWGANVHQDQAGWGDAVTNAAIRRDMQMMKDAGFNCIRGSHYPHDPAFAEACDEIGMIFFSENAFWGTGGAYGDRFSWTPPTSSGYPNNPAYRENYDRSVLAQLKAMIRIHRNNASIAAWSMSNEPFFSDGVTYPAMKNLLNMAVDSARVWDPTREPAIGGAQRGEIDRLGRNAIAFYNGDGASRQEFQNPGVPNLVSEYGSTVADRPGPFTAGWRDLDQTPGYPDPFNPPAWRSGQLIWCGFDHGTIFGKGMATMGMVDYFRIPKRQYYWYVAALVGRNHPHGNLEVASRHPQWPKEGIPVGLKLEATSTIITSTDGTDDTQLMVTVVDASGTPISNNIPVEFTIVSGPGEFPTGRRIRFMPPSEEEASDITIRDGKAAITFRSYHAGRTVIEARSESLPPAVIEIITQGTPVWEEGITKPAADRPYRRAVTRRGAEEAYPSEMLIATHRPTWVSSTLEDTSKAYVNDDNRETLWKPATADKERWWKLALEASYCIRRIQVELPDENVSFQYKIEVSTDDMNWKEIISDRLTGGAGSQIRTFQGEFGCNIAFVRITFLSANAGLVEVRIGGKP